MQPRITIRAATAADGQALLGFSEALSAEALPVLYRRSATPTLEAEAEFIARMLDAPNSLLLLALSGDEVVGVLDVHGSSHPQRAHGVSMGISVRHGHRGRGVARALIEAMCRWVETHPVVSRVELQVFATNRPAIGLYEGAGFRLEGRRVGAVRVGDELVDLLVMARRWPGKTPTAGT